ncbi:MAG TPA: hypothetical protein VEY07_00540 [Thermoplasmata archaeon]|nr:hypothetical protein [Thermoplasmata archaeon]
MERPAGATVLRPRNWALLAGLVTCFVVSTVGLQLSIRFLQVVGSALGLVFIVLFLISVLPDQLARARGRAPRSSDSR